MSTLSNEFRIIPEKGVYNIFQNELIRIESDENNPLLSIIYLGDMVAVYTKIEEGLSLAIVPQSRMDEVNLQKLEKGDSLIQVSVDGDIIPTAYAGGLSMRNGFSVEALKFNTQYIEYDGEAVSVITEFLREDGQKAIHRLKTHTAETLVSNVIYLNGSNHEITLNMLSSFSLSGLTPFIEDEASESMILHRFRSYWSAEGRPESIAIEDLQLEPSWSKWATKCERFGQVGTMPTRHFFPFAAIEDIKSGVTWGAEIAWPGSWQMEPYRRGDALSLSGGLADFEFGHWQKNLLPGEEFTTPDAILTVTVGGRDEICDRLLTYFDPFFENLPGTEQDLPIIFNEYCDTWNNPTRDSITRELNSLKGLGVEYFVIDEGWSREHNEPYHDGYNGDWNVSKDRFDGDIRPSVEQIRSEEMLPGIWFEYEIACVGSNLFKENQDKMLTRHGKLIRGSTHAFLDFCDPWVQEYLYKKVAVFLKENNIGYLKIDYNDTFGVGCDGFESLGEGLRQQVKGTYDFRRRILECNPDLVLENCASGGHRLDPFSMSECSMASFSDAHECLDIPVIASNLHMLIHPRQSQIWAVLRAPDSPRRIVYSMINGLLGRLCISGSIHALSNEQVDLVKEGVDFYKQVRHIIRDGVSRRICKYNKASNNLKGWQAVTRRNKIGNEILLTIHAFGEMSGKDIKVTIPEGFKIKKSYCAGKAPTLEGATVNFSVSEDFSAAAVHLVREN